MTEAKGMAAISFGGGSIDMTALDKAIGKIDKRGSDEKIAEAVDAAVKDATHQIEGAPKDEVDPSLAPDQKKVEVHRKDLGTTETVRVQIPAESDSETGAGIVAAGGELEPPPAPPALATKGTAPRD